MEKNKLSILIPVYNEGKTILETIKKVSEVILPHWKMEIIVIDDGSTDNTPKILNEIEKTSDITVIYGKENLGKGGALKHGLSFANGDWVLIQDADLEYNPDEYQTLLSPIEEGRAEVVFGSRLLKRNKRNSVMYVIGDIVATFMFNRIYKTHLTDLATCYKVFPKKIIPNLLPIEENDFVFDVVRLSEEIAKEKLIIKEVPISYTPRWYKKGKKLTFSNGIKIIRILLRKLTYGIY